MWLLDYMIDAQKHRVVIILLLLLLLKCQYHELKKKNANILFKKILFIY